MIILASPHFCSHVSSLLGSLVEGGGREALGTMLVVAMSLTFFDQIPMEELASFSSSKVAYTITQML
jgi:hypothetical protein